VAPTALEILNSIVGVMSFALTTVGIAVAALTILVAALAIFGWAAIRDSAVKAARELAQKRMDEYLSDEHFENMLGSKIDEVVSKRQVGVLIARSPPTGADNRPAFPQKAGTTDSEEPKS